MFVLFQFDPEVKIYSYFQIYTGNNLLADIGGLAGLFLGISLYSLFGFGVRFLKRLHKKEEEQKRQRSLDVAMNQS
jgi:hypothetical protein